MIEIIKILLPLFIFFIAQVTIKKDKPLAILVLILLTGSLYYSPDFSGELALLIIGLLAGLLIEVCLGLILRTQHWEHASFFGVPYWLPLVWGYGFIIIHRLGDVVLQLF